MGDVMESTDGLGNSGAPRAGAWFRRPATHGSGARVKSTGVTGAQSNSTSTSLGTGGIRPNSDSVDFSDPERVLSFHRLSSGLGQIERAMSFAASQVSQGHSAPRVRSSYNA